MADLRDKSITLLVIPASAGAEVRRLRVPRRWIPLGFALALVAVFALVAVGAHDLYLLGELEDMRALRTENVQLRAEVERLDERLEGLGTMLDRVQQFDAQLRRITMLSDPERNLAIGPVGELERTPTDPLSASGAGLKRDLLGDDNARALDLVERRLEFLSRDTQETEGRLRALEVHLEDQRALLASTPSLSPAKGWKTSQFGFRTDPYTGLRQMHAGVDVSASIGTPVIATGDGQVVWAAPHGGYGNVIMIDHGHNLTSFYAHLSEIGVKLGETVRRGDRIGKVGNTGRSTGPHLHYEIRVRGVPQDPERFILE